MKASAGPAVLVPIPVVGGKDKFVVGSMDAVRDSWGGRVVWRQGEECFRVQ